MAVVTKLGCWAQTGRCVARWRRVYNVIVFSVNHVATTPNRRGYADLPRQPGVSYMSVTRSRRIAAISGKV